MLCTPAIWVQTAPVQSSSMPTVHCLSRPLKPERQAEYDDGIGAGPEGWEHTMLQDGREVYKFATHALAKAATMAAEKIGFDLNELDKIVPHQANIRIIETAMSS